MHRIGAFAQSRNPEFQILNSVLLWLCSSAALTVRLPGISLTLADRLELAPALGEAGESQETGSPNDSDRILGYLGVVGQDREVLQLALSH